MDGYIDVKMKVCDLGYGRTKAIIVNPETGETIFEHFEGSIQASFYQGCNVVPATLYVSREVADGGSQYITITDYNNSDKPEILCGYWQKQKKYRPKNEVPKHTGGKQSYVLIPKDKYAELKENLSAQSYSFLFTLLDYVQWHTGLLVDTKTKKPLMYEDLIKISDTSRMTVSRRLNELKSYGVISKDVDGYKISREYVIKG